MLGKSESFLKANEGNSVISFHIIRFFQDLTSSSAVNYHVVEILQTIV